MKTEYNYCEFLFYDFNIIQSSPISSDVYSVLIQFDKWIRNIVYPLSNASPLIFTDHDMQQSIIIHSTNENGDIKERKK